VLNQIAFHDKDGIIIDNEIIQYLAFIESTSADDFSCASSIGQVLSRVNSLILLTDSPRRFSSQAKSIWERSRAAAAVCHF